ncbi:hypothetical protein MKC70_17850 [[Clostridium] innocuum]|nr:hypothetical protein [Erysipelotrichaceae bacterium]MCR0384343.1 hypothetical protein [[Clostridium] innocuum]
MYEQTASFQRYADKLFAMRKGWQSCTRLLSFCGEIKHSGCRIQFSSR